MATSFRKVLQDGVTDMCNTAVASQISTVGKYIPEGNLDLSDFPCLVVSVRQKGEAGPMEYGTLHELWDWTIHIYYLNITEEWDAGEELRDQTMHDLETYFESNPKLMNISGTMAATPVVTEYVFDSKIDTILYDQGGQDQYFTFSGQLYLTAHTAKR